MDGVALIREAEAAGLAVHLDGDRLVVRGPRSAEAAAQRLIANKPAVVAALSGGGPVAPAIGQAVETRPLKKSDGPCYWCGRRDWWQVVALPDVVRCGWCHPPVFEAGIAWLNRPTAAAPAPRG